MSKQNLELKPTIIASSANISDWEQVFNGLIDRLSLSDFVDEDQGVRETAALTMIDPSVPPPGAPPSQSVVLLSHNHNTQL